ncbi:PLP-dependent enzyme, glutamate decarboxylase [Desulfitobacterium dehalogenans ATCC 51507]|uniref:PLP-dependent enzyme, glutamate decarboxylase n=1 Tax=Desulfitobacterium dehalogenans (strain ATCC 51507 / DSM 9161 / JW/IU-DC1) TaxID=756499 RepID=I4A885_DESDJ|nr:aminotransferase class V-fold PLP-dependent enzyme [Desulfitobacterium dehalogenans]AFM00170.1 PLP-dependent enzyme, glutamate decarboxylase [Desulfitobacterium dehalogenans ATCC 51507]
MHEKITTSKQIENAAEEFIRNFFSYYRKLPNDKIINEIDNDKIENLRKIGIPIQGRAIDTVVNEMVEDIYQYGNNVNHPRYLGFIPGPASMLSWLGDVMTSAFNRHAGSWVSCPAASCIEQELIGWLCDQAGFTEKSGGLFVSGGSMANLTAMTVARDKILSEETQHLGVAYVSEQTHSSVAKGLRIIGIPDSRIRRIPVDSYFKMDTDHLTCSIQKDIDEGLAPFIVIASAGTTNTGSIDPFEKISSICQRYGMWMHVDGAFGASVLLTKTHKNLLKGIELSDSISWDAHKWLFQTYACGMILVKNRENLMNSFHVQPEYLKDLGAVQDSFNPWEMGIELTRPARGLKLWFTLQVMGSDAIGAAIEHGFQLAEWAEDELKKNKEIEIVSPAQMAIVNFRYSPRNMTEHQKDELNQQISKKMLDSGYAGIFTTEINGKKVLRICAIHPDTTEVDIRNTVRLLNRYFEELVSFQRTE